MKVLYTFYHGAAFGWSLVHSLAIHKNDEVDLLVAEGWDWCVGKPRLLLLLLRFAELGFFKNVYLYDNRLGRDGKLYDTLEKTEEAILKGMDSRLAEQGCDITSYDYIYSNTDGEDTLGIYLSLKQKEFYWFEMGPNLLTFRTEKWVRETYNQMPGYSAALLKHKTLYGENKRQSYILYPNSNKDHFPEDRCQVIDIENLAVNLPEDLKKLILKTFDLEGYECPQNASMLLLQSNWLPGLVYGENQFIRDKFSHHWYYMYFAIQCMLDYYLPQDTIPILKTHPTVLIDERTSERYFEGAFSFHALFTVLLTKSLLPNLNPKYKIMLGSSANRSLEKNPNDIHCPGVWLFSLFYHKYYVVLDILKYMDYLYEDTPSLFGTIGQAGSVMNYNTDYLMQDIQYLMALHFVTEKKESTIKYSIVQIESELNKKLEKYDLLVYTDVWNTMNSSSLYELTKKYYVVTLRISKKAIKESNNIIFPLEDDYIYLISKRPDFYETLKNYKMEKNNRYAGYQINCNIYSFQNVVFSHDINEYPIRENINLLDCWKHFGKHYIDSQQNEIIIGGKITNRAIENMQAISIKFSGTGKNKVTIKDLDTPNKYAGNFRIEVLNGSCIEIGRTFFANSNVLVHSSNSEVIIDDDVMFANNVVIKAMNYHSIYEFDGKRLPNRNLYIGKHVWLGYDSTVYAGSVIGSGSVIGGKIPNNCIAVGNPARVVRKNIFWQFSGDKRDYYDLPENMQTVNEYIAETK